MRKTDAALVGVHREDASAFVQPPSLRQCCTRLDAQGDGGPAVRFQSGDSQRSTGCILAERHIQRRFRIRSSLEQHIVGILNGCNKTNPCRKCRIGALVNRNVLRVSRVKIDFVYPESDGLCDNGRVVGGNGNGVGVVINEPLAREILPHAERDGDRLLPLFNRVVFNGNRRGDFKNAAGDGGRRSDGETVGRGGCRVAIAIGGTILTVGFRVGEGKGNIAGDVRVREAYAGRIPELEPEGKCLSLAHNRGCRLDKPDGVLFVGKNGEGVGLVAAEIETPNQTSRQGDGDFLVGLGRGGGIIVDGHNTEDSAVLVRKNGDGAVVGTHLCGAACDRPINGDIRFGRCGRNDAEREALTLPYAGGIDAARRIGCSEVNGPRDGRRVVRDVDLEGSLPADAPSARQIGGTGEISGEAAEFDDEIFIGIGPVLADGGDGEGGGALPRRKRQEFCRCIVTVSGDFIIHFVGGTGFVHDGDGCIRAGR